MESPTPEPGRLDGDAASPPNSGQPPVTDDPSRPDDGAVQEIGDRGVGESLDRSERGYEAGDMGAEWHDDAASDDVDEAPSTREVAAPRVETVVVAHRPGDWFEETLHSLAAQDYLKLHVTVVIAGEDDGVSARVTAVLPDASLCHVDESYGYGRSANEALHAMGVPPAFFLFCHDDVALAPDAVRLLVEEALRSNAAVVGPKLVAWDKADVLLEVGLDVDKLAHVAARIEVGELDQEQHDAVTDVFAVSGAVQLVRADLFSALGGYDATMGVTGEDVDLCWRAHVAGARVLVAPSAVARHQGGIEERRGDLALERLRERHRVRTVLTAYGPLHSLRVVPQALLYSLLRAITALLTGQFGRARAAMGAWLWNMRHPTSLIDRRARLRRLRQVPDSDIRRLQVSGFAPVSEFVRGQFAAEGTGSITVRSRNVLRALRSGPSRVSIGFWAITVVALVFGSRHLITRRVPAVGDLVAFDLGIGELFGRFVGSWRTNGAGHDAAAPTAFALVGAMGVVFGGAMALLRTVLTVGMIPVGAIGVWRLLRPFSSPWIRVVGTMMYLASPVPYDALASGTWAALLLHGGLPWVLAGLARGAGIAPFGRRGGAVGEGILEPSMVREILALGLLLGVLVAFVPFVGVVVAFLVLAVVLGSWLAAAPAGFARVSGVAGGALLVAVVLNLPWLLSLVGDGSDWTWVLGTRPDDAPTFEVASLLRLDTGSTTGGLLGFALPAAAAVPLLVARGPRWAWAVRGLVVYLGVVAVLWSDGRDWIPFALPRAEVVLAAGSLGLAVAAAMGVAAIERDLRTYRLGWRQLLPITSVLAIALAMVPVTVAAVDGTWGMPKEDFNRQFAADVDASTGRVLWLGHDDVLGPAGRRFGDGLTYAVTDEILVGFEDRFRTGDAPGDPLVEEAIHLALEGGTSHLGRLLAPFGITEILVLEQSAPAPSTGLRAPLPESLRAAMAEQLDLAQIDVAPGLIRLLNRAALPPAAIIPAGATSGRSLREFAAEGLVGEADSMRAENGSSTTLVGTVSVDQEVYLAVPGSSSWRLTVDGRAASRATALDVGTAFAPSTSGPAELRHRTTGRHQLMMVGQALLWIVAGVALLRINTNAREVRR